MGDNLSKLDGVKRIFLILYCMIASCSFAYAFGVDSLEYVVTKNSEGNPAVYVKGLTSRGKSAKLYTIYVPDTVEYEGTAYPVCGIGANAFQNNKTVSDFVLPQRLDYIGSNAFADCSNVYELYINEVTIIQANAFDKMGGCFLYIEKLKGGMYASKDYPFIYTIIKECENAAIMEKFANNTHIAYMVIGGSIRYIKSDCFSGCTNLKAVVLPSTLKGTVSLSGLEKLKYSSFGPETYSNISWDIDEGSVYAKGDTLRLNAQSKYPITYSYLGAPAIKPENSNFLKFDNTHAGISFVDASIKDETGAETHLWKYFLVGPWRAQVIKWDLAGSHSDSGYSLYVGDSIEVKAYATSGLPVRFRREYFRNSTAKSELVEHDGKTYLIAGLVGGTYANGGINAYQDGDKVFKSAYSNMGFDIDRRSQWMVVDKEEATIHVGDSLILNDFAHSTSGVPVEFSLGDATSYGKIIEKDGTYTFYSLKKGSVQVNASLKDTDQYYNRFSKYITITSLPLSQEIVWKTETHSACIDDSIRLEAQTSANLPVSYTITHGASIAHIVTPTDSTFLLVGDQAGTVTVAAIQKGDNMYAADTLAMQFTFNKIHQTLSWGEVDSTWVYRVGEGRGLLAQARSTAENAIIRYKITEGTDIAVLRDGEISGLKAGVFTLTAYADENDKYFAADSVSKQLTVYKGLQEVRWKMDSTLVRIGEPMELVAKSNAALQVGYEIKNGADCAKIVELDGKFYLQGIKVGAVEVTAFQTGNEDWEAADSTTLLFNICEREKLLQTITWDQPVVVLPVDGSIELKAVSSAGLAVSYAITEGNDYAELVKTDSCYRLKGLKLGKVKVVASQQGTEEYLAADSVPFEFWVDAFVWEQKTSWVAIGESIVLDARYESGRPVKYFVQNSEGVAELIEQDSLVMLKGLKPGTVFVIAMNDVGGLEAKGFGIKKKDNNITWEHSSYTLSVGDSIALAATSSSGLPVSYKITEGADCAELVLSDSVYTLKALRAGTVAIEASQEGDSVYSAAQSVVRQFTVEKKAQRITWEQTATTMLAGESITLTATSSSGLPINYEIAEGREYVELLLSDSVCVLKGLQPGTVTVVARQAGDDIYAAADSITMSFSITEKEKLQQTIMWNQNIEIAKGTTLTMQAVSSSGLPITYTYERPEGAFAAPASIEGAEIYFEAPGAYILYANQEGNDDYEAAEPVKMEFNVLDETYDDLMYIDGIYYRYADDDKNSLKVVYGYKKYEGDIVIPEKASGMPVVQLDTHAFYACYGLKSVVVGENVREIGWEALGACKYLESVTLPYTCNFVLYAFNASPSIKEIHCHASIPYEVQEEVFNSATDYTSCVLYVPRGSKALYEQAEVWKNFTHIVEEDVPTGIHTVYKFADGVDIYTLSGILVRAKAKDTKGLKPGVYVAGGRRIAVK